MNPVVINAEVLRDLRLGRGWSVSDLATKSGVAISVLYRLENGSTTRPYMKTLRPLAKVLRVEVTDLLVVRQDAA